MQKVCFFYEDLKARGWSEQWWTPDPPSVAQQQANIAQYVQTRKAMLGTEVTITYARVSQVQAAGVQFVRQSYVIPVQVDGKSSLGSADFPDTRVLVKCYNATKLSVKNWFCGGIPDDLVKPDGTLVVDPNWTNALNQLLAGMKTNGWGWVGVSNNPIPTDLTAVVQNAVTGQVELTFIANFFGALPKNLHVSILLKDVDGAFNLNGYQTVIIDSPTTCHTLRRVGINAWNGHGNGTLKAKALIPVNTFVSERTVERKAGRPSYQSAGRRHRQVRG